MTHVMNYTAAASQNENILMEYMVEVITFDGESEFLNRRIPIKSTQYEANRLCCHRL